MAWRVLKAGAMLEVSNGFTTLPSGRDVEQTTTVIAREGEIIRRDLSKSMTDRYIDGDDYVRSLVEPGDVSVNDDGDEVFTPKNISADAEEQPVLSDEESALAVAQANQRVTELEDRLTEATAHRNQAVEQHETLASELETVKSELAAAQEQLGTALSYEDLSPEALEAEAKKKNVYPASGSGKDGKVVKADLVQALEGAASSS